MAIKSERENDGYKEENGWLPAFDCDIVVLLVLCSLSLNPTMSSERSAPPPLEGSSSS